jgi:hypothetical protein
MVARSASGGNFVKNAFKGLLKKVRAVKLTDKQKDVLLQGVRKGGALALKKASGNAITDEDKQGVADFAKENIEHLVNPSAADRATARSIGERTRGFDLRKEIGNVRITDKQSDALFQGANKVGGLALKRAAGAPITAEDRQGLRGFAREQGRHFYAPEEADRATARPLHERTAEVQREAQRALSALTQHAGRYALHTTGFRQYERPLADRVGARPQAPSIHDRNTMADGDTAGDALLYAAGDSAPMIAATA